MGVGFHALCTLLAHLRQGSHTTFVASSTRLDSLSNPLFLLPELLVEQSVRRLFILSRFFLSSQEVSVIARPACDLAAIDFQYARGEFLQECPIVSDEQYGARVRVDLVLEPLDRRNIEMICRLVEEQQIRFLNQRLRKSNASPPAAGQLVHFLLCRNFESGNRFFNALLDMPAVMRVDLGV